MAEWMPIETAPRDGTEIILTWMENGAPQEQYPMVWDAGLRNPPFQDHAGIWVMKNRFNGKPMATWTEAHPGGAPTHWRPLPPTTERE